MNRHEFDILLQKYLAGECSEEEQKQVEAWSEQMLQHSRIRLSGPEQSVLKRRLWKRVRSSTTGGGVLWGRLFRFSWGLAASVLVGCLIAFALLREGREETAQRGQALHEGLAGTSEGSVTVHSEGKEQTIVLEDGSRVVLGKESSIRYPVKFSGHLRQVHLEGEAFFKVKRDESRPFLVFSGDLVTKVLGTSFTIRSSARTGKVEVEVVSGSVSVYEHKGTLKPASEAVILTPNQKIVFEKNVLKLVPEPVDEPVLVNGSGEEAALVFEDALLPEVLTEVSARFEIDITVDSPALKSCRFTGDLGGLPLHTQLKLIGRSVNGRFDLQGNAYFLRGEGCNTPD